jgi:hypothetical protein
MKNEKYRLQVGKNSLQSLAKAVEHMLQGGTSVGNKALTEFERIDPNGDLTEFIRINRQPYERSKRIVPAYHGNDSLKEVMREYLTSLGASSLMPSEHADKTPRSPMNSNYQLMSVPSGEVPDSPDPSPRAHSLSVDDDQTASSNGNADAAESSANEDESGGSVMDQDEEFAEAQPLGVSDFQKKFKVRKLLNPRFYPALCSNPPDNLFILALSQLDSHEQVVESFSCALYLSNFPFHGRLYLTRNRMCFSGWRDTIFVRSSLLGVLSRRFFI